MKFVGATFSNQSIDIDFNDYSGCRFDNCTMTYHGVGPVGMQACSFNSVRWVFVDAAGNTLKFMAALYTGAGQGGKDVIERTFDTIRKSSAPRSLLDLERERRMELAADPANPGWVKGWAVYRNSPWTLRGVFSTEQYAREEQAAAGLAYEVAYGAHRIGSDDFIAERAAGSKLTS